MEKNANNAKQIAHVPRQMDLEVSEESLALIEYMRGPVFLLEPNGTIAWRNLASVDQVFLETVGLAACSFKFIDPTVNGAVQALIETVLETGGGDAHHLDAEGGNTRWRILAFRKGFVRVGGDQSFTKHQRVLILWQILPSGRLERAKQPEVRLSPMERRLVNCIATGQTVRQASLQLNVSYHTARKYLQSVFVKTGSKRQTELVALASSWSPTE